MQTPSHPPTQPDTRNATYIATHQYPVTHVNTNHTHKQPVTTQQTRHTQYHTHSHTPFPSNTHKLHTSHTHMQAIHTYIHPTVQTG